MGKRMTNSFINAFASSLPDFLNKVKSAALEVVPSEVVKSSDTYSVPYAPTTADTFIAFSKTGLFLIL